MSILTQVESQLKAIPGVSQSEAEAVARVLTFGDSLRSRSREEILAVLAVHKKWLAFVHQG